MGIQVPEPCGNCATVVHKEGLCKPDGSPLVVLVVVSCRGDEITTSIIDPESGLPYAGPVVECGGDCCDEAATSVVDTNSIDLTLAGNVLSADLQLDPASPAALAITANGLYVECCDDTVGTVSDTNSIDLTLAGNVLSADLLLDPASPSPLSITANGLYVECCEDAATSVIDTNSIDLTLIGGNLSADLQLDPASPAPLAITANGLYVECCDETVASVADTNSVDMVLTGDVLSANVRIDPASTAPVSVGPAGIKIDCCDFENDGGWFTQVKLSNELFLGNVGADILGLPGFTPIAGAIYEIEAKLLVSSSVANNGTRGRMQFPVGLTAFGWTARSVDGSAGLEAISYGGPSTLTGSSNVPIVNQPYLIAMAGMVDVGPAPAAGDVRPQAATENAGVSITVWRGSIFKWRRVL